MIKKNKIRKIIVGSDIHIPHENKVALRCFLKAISLIKPDGVTLLGDIGDFSTFCSHDIKKAPKKNWNETLFYEKSLHEFEALNEFLDEVDKRAGKAKKTYCFGNHEAWVKNFCDENPKARHKLFNIADRLYLKNRSYKVYAYNEIIREGKLRLTHGMYCGNNHSKKHFLAFNSSVLYGHCHNIEIYSAVTIENESHMAFANPCLCEMNPGYLKGKPNNWNHGFSIIYVWPNGKFQVNVIRIQNGRCVVEGKEIIG